jgi:predicted kinase
MLPSCRKRERAELASLARKHGARFVGLFLTADLATRLARIEQRKSDASDATRDVVLMQETFSIGAVDWQHGRCLGYSPTSRCAAR